MFTLKIIFYGLIAFVPDIDNKGLTAILLDAYNLGLAKHVPMVSLYRGLCEGNDCPLPWYLAKVDLQFSGLPKLDQGKVMDGLPVSAPKNLSGFPVDSQDMKNLKWIPRMGDVESAADRINPDCLIPKLNTCLKAARIKLVGKGAASACHFLHDEKNTKDILRGYFFAGPNEFGLFPVRAIADALEVEFQVAAKEIKLEEVGFSGSVLRKITLKPVNDEVILLVTNQPAEKGNHSGHFLAYYKISNTRQIKGNRLHQSVWGSTKKVSEAGSCEVILSQDYRPEAHIPHNKAECDAVLFHPEKLDQ